MSVSRTLNRSRGVRVLQRHLAEVDELERQTPAGWCPRHKRSYMEGRGRLWMCPQCVSGDIEDEDDVVGAVVGG